MTITDYFVQLNTKDIICWGSGKHFRNSTCPFLMKSGLINNLKGFVDYTKTTPVEIGGRSYPRIGKKELAFRDRRKTVILITVSGYDEVLSQLRADTVLSDFEAVPSIYPEFLYGDKLLLSADKPPKDYRKQDRQIIPGILHAIWFSTDPLPPLYQKCLDSWKKYAPDMEIKIWDLKNYKADHCLFFEQAVECGNWAFASDYARADLLRRYGGVYMDLDVEVLRPIDDLLYNDAYMSFESLDRIECGSGMGATPEHPVMQKICESYENRPYLKADGSWDNSTCPVRYTQVIEKYGLKKNGGFQFIEDITVYPFEVLTAKSFDTGIIYKTDLTYTLHHHNGSWIPGRARDAVTERYQNIQSFLASKGIIPEI